MSLVKAINETSPNYCDDIENILGNDCVLLEEVWDIARESEKIPVFGNIYQGLLYPKVIDKIIDNIINLVNDKLNDYILDGKIEDFENTKNETKINELKDVLKTSLDEYGFSYFINSTDSFLKFNYTNMLITNPNIKFPSNNETGNNNLDIFIYNEDDINHITDLVSNKFIEYLFKEKILNKTKDFSEEIDKKINLNFSKENNLKP